MEKEILSLLNLTENLEKQEILLKLYLIFSMDNKDAIEELNNKLKSIIDYHVKEKI